MELKDMTFLSARNISINFFGSLVVSQEAVKEIFSAHIIDYDVRKGLMNSRICHVFNDILVIDLKELVRLYIYLRANKNEVILVLGYLIDRGVVYERPGAYPIRYSELWHGSPVGAYIASALYEQERPVKGESEEGTDRTEEKN